jgi:selenium-binding protein 1
MRRRWTPDPTFYPSPALAVYSPAETLAYVALVASEGDGRRDGIGVVDTRADSPTFGRLVGRLDFPHAGNEVRHFGWNACSSHLCPSAPHAHVERRYLIVPGTRSSRIHVVDTRPDAREPRLVRVIERDELARKTGYAAPHSVHCGPDGVYVNALGAPNGDGPGGIFTLDHETFEVRGAWERERGPQRLASDFFWHLGHDTMITSEWGTPNMVSGGLRAELLRGGGYGHALHVWSLRSRRHVQTIELGADHQMTLSLRPAHNPRRAYGFVGVVVSPSDLSASVFCWYVDRRDGRETWAARKVITVPAERARPEQLPPVLREFGVVPPLVTDVCLSVDDRWLYVSCWGTGEVRRYDVSDPLLPVLTGVVRLGGVVRRTPHPGAPREPITGAPQMVEASRDGKRVYVTNSLLSPWDAQFYPDGLHGWMAKLDARADGSLAVDPRFLVRFPDGVRAHQVRLEGGDASSDSFCFS